jgi:hypothetical protein
MDSTADLWDTAEPQDAYAPMYRRLAELRELFHSHGRMDDSNAKLDEVIKLLAAYLAYRRGLIESFPSAMDSKHPLTIPALQSAFREAATLPCYADQNGESVFGPEPSLTLQDTEAAFARLLVETVTAAVDQAFEAKGRGASFDLLNEAFGHFVRDNFRSNTEDAQYLTPPEVVDFMVDVALHDIANDHKGKTPSYLEVLDPCCGVGSFLAAISHRRGNSSVGRGVKLHLHGQDKVQRMVRLSTINLALFESAAHRITVGNSVMPGSPLDELTGRMDLILTNPPFGARFHRDMVRTAPTGMFPLFGGLPLPDGYIDSELLFVDRCLSLLKPGGRLMIVLPDGVVSAKGIAALLRTRLAPQADLRMITGLPPVTFAQAGTRTRTVVLYLQKKPKAAIATKNLRPVLMATCASLGFEVSSRKGVQVKSTSGGNDLAHIAAVYTSLPRQPRTDSHTVASTTPSAVWIDAETVHSSAWTPSHFSASRFAAIDALSASNTVNLLPLSQLARLESDARKARKASPDSAYISILHVIGEGILDVAAAVTNCPKTPGVPVNPGEVLLSRINPRNPRVIVVPDLGRPILCSAEFEILKPIGDLDAYGLAFVLLTDAVSAQVASLATGTSASHNRVRSEDLAGVLVPVPKDGARGTERIRKLIDEYRTACRQLSGGILNIVRIREAYQRGGKSH